MSEPVVLDPDRADPAALASALRAKCEGNLIPFAAALLGVLEECEKLIKDEADLIHRHEITADYTPEDAHGEGFADGQSRLAIGAIRAAARAYVKAGGKLTGEGEG